MKRFFLCAAMALCAALVGCNKELTDRVDEIENRVDKIEVDLKAAVEAIQEATQKGYYILSYEELSDGSGYTFTFTNGKAVTILNGKKGDTGSNGDKGDKGDQGDSFFSDIKITDTDVTFKLSDGREFTLMLEAAFSLNIKTDSQKIVNGSTVELPYTVTNATSKTVVDYMVSGSYLAEIVPASVSEGVVKVTAPQESSSAKLLVFADNGTGRTSIKTISFSNDETFSSEADVAVSVEGGQFEHPITYNVACSVSFSESWIHLVETKSVTTTFVFKVDENTGLEARTAKVLVKAGDVTVQTLTVAQEAPHGIRNYNELLEFQKVSNSEKPDYAKFMDKDGVVKLLADIDCSGSGTVNEWIPICDADIARTATNLGCMEGWSGIFDGQNHSIKNLKINDEKCNSTCGFFGAIYKGTVRNLVFDSSCAIDIVETGKAGGTLYGTLAALINGGVIENVIYKGTVNLKHSTSAGFMSFGGIVAAAGCTEMNTVIKGCKFEGIMSGESRTNNNTSTSPRMGGIVGYSVRVAAGQPYAAKGDFSISIIGCDVSGTLNLKGLRDGGIVGQTAGGNIVDDCKFTGKLINNCENNNTGTNIYAVARVGGIVGYVEPVESAHPDEFKNCEVNGTVVDLMQGAVGGLVGFTKVASFSDCSVNAKVASKYYGDKNPLDASKSIAYNAGVVVGNIQDKNAKFTSVKAKGEFAKDYVTDLVNPVALTEANVADYLIGTYAADTDISGITFWK